MLQAALTLLTRKKVSSAFLLVIAPFFFCFCTFIIFSSFLNLSLSFPFFIFFGLALIFSFHSLGLYLAYALFIPLVIHNILEANFWNLLSLYVFSVEYFIALIAFETANDHIKNKNLEVIQEANEKWEKEKEALEQELQKFKEEAKRRYLEKNEIENQLLSFSQEQEALKLTNGKLRSEIHALKQEVKKHLELLQEKEKMCIPLVIAEEKPQELNPLAIEEWKRKISQIEGQYKQLRMQFEEKSQVLSQTRRELFQTQGKLLALEKENLCKDEQDHFFFTHELEHIEDEMQKYIYEIDCLEKIISSLYEELQKINT